MANWLLRKDIWLPSATS
ncbi:hypothetical protein STIAU_7801, partial [Stigmatella aurantiaca DW4/3-1]